MFVLFLQTDSKNVSHLKSTFNYVLGMNLSYYRICQSILDLVNLEYDRDTRYHQTGQDYWQSEASLSQIPLGPANKSHIFVHLPKCSGTGLRQVPFRSPMVWRVLSSMS